MLQKIFFSFLFLLTISGCKKSNVTEVKTDYIIDDNTPLKIVVIDNCEYLYGAWGNATVLTHKGNCKNDIHYD